MYLIYINIYLYIIYIPLSATQNILYKELFNKCLLFVMGAGCIS